MIKPTTRDWKTRQYGKRTDINMKFEDVPDLTKMQIEFYKEFLQTEVLPSKRPNTGLHAIFKEIFPIKSYDGNIELDFIEYRLGEPRHNEDECRKLGLTFGMPLKLKVRLSGAEIETVTEEAYLGDIPKMIGGGEFIINGAERVIVAQLQRSPGVDFSETKHPSGKTLPAARIIPERGSWMQVEVSQKDIIYVRIDRSSKIPATMVLRALSPDFSTDASIIRLFYPTENVTIADRNARDKIVNKYVVEDVFDKATGEVVIEKLETISDADFKRLRELEIKKVEVISELRDDIIIKTLQDDDSDSHEEALKKIYIRLRPGNPPDLEKARELFFDRFYNENRYNFGQIGRFRINRKFGSNIDENITTFRKEDMVEIIRYLMKMRFNEGVVDDIDHLGNRRVRTIADLVGDELRKGLLKLKRSVRERMSLKKDEPLTPRKLINSQTVSAALQYFYARGELSQVVDQTNPLAQLTHERRLSALGPGGLNRKRAGFEVRDVHASHYGRICPIETPEGTNIGLIVSLSIYAMVNPMGFLTTPYIEVKNGKLTDKMIYLRGDEETDKIVIQNTVPVDSAGRITSDIVLGRCNEDFGLYSPDQVQFMDVSSKQLVGVAASLIPFLEHDDANRALMGSNMQRQAVPLLTPELPVVGTGVEREIARNSGMIIRSDIDGEVEYVDSKRIVIAPKEKGGKSLDSMPVEYDLKKFVGLNERTCLNQKPMVELGQKVAKGEIISEGAGTKSGELSLGRNVLVAFMSWEGFNFEDAIIVSESLLKADVFTSVHIEEFTLEVRDTKLGKEEITRDIPNVSADLLKNLDETGCICVGTKVKTGDILVGKISPKSKSELSPEEKLVRAIFGRAGDDVKNDSLEVKPGCEGVVIDVSKFSRRFPISSEEKKEQDKQIRKIEKEYDDRILEEIKGKKAAMHELLGAKVGNTRTKDSYKENSRWMPEDFINWQTTVAVEDVECTPSKSNALYMIFHKYDKRIERLLILKDKETSKVRRGDELPTGVLELVKVYVAIKRKLSVGDKMAGRHGNKGVIAKIVPEEDMPFLADGTPVQMILNPLGVPSRMNFGQILETHLGWAAHKLGFRAITPPFDGATELEIEKALEEAGLPKDGKAVLYDGRTGESFDQKVTVGYIYMLKLHHLVADKIHARATGPYSLITQQPLGGKARFGGQRFGEMEVWAMEAYGAANILQELLTVKSDDVDGRTKVYESMVKGENVLEPGTPIAFQVLTNELKGLALNVKLEKSKKK